MARWVIAALRKIRQTSSDADNWDIAPAVCLASAQVAASEGLAELALRANLGRKRDAKSVVRRGAIGCWPSLRWFLASL